MTTDSGTNGGPPDRAGQTWWLRPWVPWVCAALLIIGAAGMAAAVGMAVLLTGCSGTG